jgi:hypothetical protein
MKIKIMAESKFKIGDKVKVTNVGGVFSTYQEMAQIMDLKNWNENERPKNKSIALIVNVQQHPCFTEKTIYGIKTKDGKDYIMSEYALQKVESGSDFDIDKKSYSIKLKDMVELFTSYDKKAELVNEINPSNTIQISRDDLNAYYEYSDIEVQDFINDNFKVDGTTTISALIELERIASNSLKPVIRLNHPKYFPKPEFDFSDYIKKYNSDIFTTEQFKLLGFNESPIEIRSCGEYKNKGFYLNNDEVEWKLIKEGNAQLLVPIKK